MVHGEGRRAGRKNEDGVFAEDRYMANWMGRFTALSEEDWLEIAGDGDVHTFDADRALEWGVIDEIVEGV